MFDSYFTILEGFLSFIFGFSVDILCVIDGKTSECKISLDGIEYYFSKLDGQKRKRVLYLYNLFNFGLIFYE